MVEPVPGRTKGAWYFGRPNVFALFMSAARSYHAATKWRAFSNLTRSKNPDYPAMNRRRDGV